MFTLEHIVYLARKLHWSREEIGKLSPYQAINLMNELMYQESVENYQLQFSIASILAAIYNTIPTKSHKVYKAKDFLGADMPRRDGKREENNIDKLAREIGIKLPLKER